MTKQERIQNDLANVVSLDNSFVKLQCGCKGIQIGHDKDGNVAIVILVACDAENDEPAMPCFIRETLSTKVSPLTKSELADIILLMQRVSRAANRFGWFSDAVHAAILEGK